MDMEKHGTRSSVNKGVMQMVVSAMMLALAVLLDFVASYIPGLSWPNGGTITIGMLPLFLAGFLCGPFWGFADSFLFGVLDMLIGTAWGYNGVSILLDYLLGFGVCGVCGFFSRPFYRKSLVLPIVGMVLAGLLRFLCSFLSGCMVMWDVANGSFDPHFDAATMTYSAVYNLGYILPSIVLSIIVFALIAKPIFLLSDSRVLENVRPASTKKDEDKKQGFLGGVLFDTILPFLSIVLVVGGALSCVPTIHYSAAGDEFVVDFLALGYVGLIIGVILLAYAIVRICLLKPSQLYKDFLTKGLTEGNKRLVIRYIATVFLCLAAIVLSSVGLFLHYGI